MSDETNVSTVEAPHPAVEPSIFQGPNQITPSDTGTPSSQNTTNQSPTTQPTQPTQPTQTPTTPLGKLNNQISQTPDQDILPPSIHAKTKMIRGIADVLSPKQYKTVINADGTSSQVPLPRRGRDIGMSIALAALTGAFSGLGEKGPGATGRAASAGFGAVAQQRQQVDQQQNQQAQQDFSRKQSTLEFNMRMKSAAMNVGLQDKEQHDSFVQSWDHLVDQWEKLPNSSDIIKAGSKEAPLSEDEAEDIVKHSPFNLLRVPVSTYPRTKDGKQVWLGLDGKIVPEGTQGAHPAWDNGYVLVDKNAKVSLSDENGPTATIKELVAKDSGIIPGVNPSLTAGDGVKTPLSAQAYGRMLLQHGNIESAQEDANKFINTLNADKKPTDKDYVKPLDVRNAIKSGKLMMGDLENFSKTVGNSSQGNTTILNSKLDAIKTKDPASASRLEAFFNSGSTSGESLEKYKQTLLAQGAAQKAAAEKAAKGLEVHSNDDANSVLSANKANPGSIPANKVDEANDFLDRDISHAEKKKTGELRAEAQITKEETDAQEARTASPEGFRADPKVIANLGPDELKAYLIKNKVVIPSDFESLYSVGREYSDNLNKVFPTRVSKGTNQTDTNHALSFIHKNINGNYNDANYEAGKRFLITLNDPQRSPVIAAGVASQHLDVLRNAGEALKNNNLQVLNSLANSLGVATGKSAPVVFKAIADQVNQEVGKVVAGGQAYEAEIKNLNENLSSKQSPEQINDVIRGYIRLMSGRLNELDFDSKRLFNKPLSINPVVTDLFNRYHQTTAWEEGSPRYVNGKLIGYTTDGRKNFKSRRSIRIK